MGWFTGGGKDKESNKSPKSAATAAARTTATAATSLTAKTTPAAFPASAASSSLTKTSSPNNNNNHRPLAVSESSSSAVPTTKSSKTTNTATSTKNNNTYQPPRTNAATTTTTAPTASTAPLSITTTPVTTGPPSGLSATPKTVHHSNKSSEVDAVANNKSSNNHKKKEAASKRQASPERRNRKSTTTNNKTTTTTATTTKISQQQRRIKNRLAKHLTADNDQSSEGESDTDNDTATAGDTETDSPSFTDREEDDSSAFESAPGHHHKGKLLPRDSSMMNDPTKSYASASTYDDGVGANSYMESGGRRSRGRGSRHVAPDEDDAEYGRANGGLVGGGGLNQNHLNSLFNGHLMKWKYEAEEGTLFLRLPAFLGALGAIAMAVCAFVYHRPNSIEPHSIVIYSTVITMSLLILVLDGRFLSAHPLSIRSHLRNILTRNFNILRFLWGRGLLYLTIGILSIGQMWVPSIAEGSFMVAVGILSILVGVHASRKFAALRNSLADESFLLLVFSNYDYDADGYIDPREFSYLLVDVGVELDDRYTLKAFNCIDKDRDRLISFEEFAYWWSSGFVERGRRMNVGGGDSEDGSYRRLDQEF